MKNILMFSLLITNFSVPTAWGNCDKIDEYYEIIQTTKEEVALLQQNSESVFNGENSSEMRKILVDVGKTMTGTDYLKEQENWQEKSDEIEEKKGKNLKYGALSGSLFLFTVGINYHLYKYPLSSAPVFSEEFLRPISGKLLSRSIGAVFLAYTSGQTIWYAYKYHNLSQDVKEAQSKINVLGKLADMEDTIKRKERMINHYEIEAQLLAQSCP